MEKNYFRVYRKIFQHPLWFTKPFDKAHAWLDLVGLANWQDKESSFGAFKRGQIRTTQKYLADRWGWHRETVLTFLHRLKTDNQVDIKTDTKNTHITIINYDKYQPIQQPIQQQSDNQSDNETAHTNKVIRKEGNIKSLTSFKKNPSCPLLNGLKDKYPLGHKECVEYITSSEEDRGNKFINRPKQFMVLHKILRAGWDFPDLDRTITQVDKKYGANAWDFTTLASWLEKQGGTSAKKTNYN